MCLGHAYSLQATISAGLTTFFARCEEQARDSVRVTREGFELQKNDKKTAEV